MGTPTQADEISFISGVNADGTVAATSFHTWNGDQPATYDTVSDASKWGSSKAGTSGGTVSYYYDPASSWSASEQTALRQGLSLWSAVANITFVQTTNAAAATLTFVRNSDNTSFESDTGGTGAYVGSTRLGNQGSATISIDTADYGFGPLGSFSAAGGYPVDTTIHEEGHFLGLGHDGPYNDTSNDATQQYSPYDTRLWSLMSYIEPSSTTAKYAGSYPVTGTNWNGNDPTTWMPLDILAAQRLYGAPTSTPLSGGQRFGYNSNIGGDLKPFFDFTVNTTPVITLWDAGANNTLDLSGCTTQTFVNLNAGTFSSFDTMTNNLAIAYGTAIDGAAGGSANDVFVVNTDNDLIDGGAGYNTTVLAAGLAGYTLSNSGGRVLVRLNATGATDILTNMEALTFSDVTVLTQNIFPTTTAFAIDGSNGIQVATGSAGSTNFISTAIAAGSGTVLADLRDGTVSRTTTLDATIANFQGLQLGSQTSVVLGLAGGTDLLYGGTGAASFYGEGATDYIQGGSRSNTVVGGAGNEIFYGNGGNDTMLGGTAQNFMRAGATSGSSDTFYGNGGTDFVYGGAGSTVLYGAGGTEDLTGGSGFNELVGSTQAPGFDILNGGSGTDLFYAGIGTNLLYEGVGTDTFAGNAGTDYIYGGAGRSFVYGGSGTDVVTTGAGNQYVSAGTGTTYFNDTAANLHAGRSDEVDGFSHGSGTYLYLPTAVQSATSFIAQSGGTAVVTAVSGGTATIFLPGAAVANVQAHTHFTL